MRPWLPLLLLAATASAWASGNPPRTLAAGEFRLPAATAFGAPGFHEVVTTAGRVRSDLRPPARFRLVLTLRDATRPQKTCSSDHPLSGCATVDWADDSSRPKVPPSGVFANTVTVQLDSGKSTFFLTPGGALARRPNQYQPG